MSGVGPIEVAVLLLVLLAVLWVRGRLASRPCPRCGKRVPNGQMACRNCEFDFNSVG